MSLWIEVLNKRRETREEDVKMLWGGGGGLGVILFDINIMLHFNRLTRRLLEMLRSFRVQKLFESMAPWTLTCTSPALLQRDYPLSEIIPHFITPFAPHPTNSKICKWHAERLVADRPVSPSLISRDVNFRSKLTNKDSSRIRKFWNYFVTVSTRVRRQDSCCRRWHFSERHSCRSGFPKWFIN